MHDTPTSRFLRHRVAPLAAAAALGMTGCGIAAESAPGQTVIATPEALATPQPDAVQPRHSGTRLLTAGQTTVEVMDPAASTSAMYYVGPRFSSVAGILRVHHAGDEYLHNPVKHDPMAEAAGLFNEFDLTTKNGPPGFKEAKVGEPFLKIGVGALKKREGQYLFYTDQEIVERAPTTVTWSADGRGVSFAQTSPAVNGYQYGLTTVLTVGEGTLSLLSTLTNLGEKAIHTEHYVHNFYAFNDTQSMGPDYEIDFPYPPTNMKLVEPQAIVGNAVTLTGPLVEKPINNQVKPPPDYTGPNTVTTKQRSSGMQIACTTSLPAAYTALHTNFTFICPEQFITLDVAPGESVEWTRSYQFGRR